MKKLYCLLIPLFLLASLSGAAEWVNLTGSNIPVTVTVLESSSDRILVNYQVNGFVNDQVVIEGEEYNFIGLADESRLWDEGNPDLPRLCRSVIIPDDALMAARIIEAQYKDVEHMRVAPSKGHFSREIDPEMVAYRFGEVYQQNAWYPENVVELRDPYILRDFRGQVIELNAFQFNPATNVMRVYTNITVEIYRDGVGGANVFERTEELTSVVSEFNRIYQRHFINLDPTDYVAVEEQGTLLVICYDPWLDAVQPLVDWKNQKGIPTTLVPVGQIGNNSTAIKNYIIGEYQTNDLTWVLLVGDAAQVATPGGYDPTYGQITGNDSYFEVLIGRFSSETLDHVNTQVERTIEYERDPQLGADWYHQGMGIASSQGAGIGHYGESDDEHMDLIRDQLMHYNYTLVDQIYDPTATAAMVTNALNAGRGIGNYCGHGSTTSWGTTGFSNTSINNLVNDNMLPFITSVACNNGTFVSSTCFGEAWIRATNNGEPTGAIGFWGSYISQSWAPPMYAQDEVIDLLTPELKHTFGGLCFNGAMKMIDETGSSGANEADAWCVFGDPSVQVWANTPETMTVVHDNQIDIGASSFEVVTTGIVGALAAISWDGDLYGSAYSNAAGLASIPLIPGTLPPAYVTLTVTAFNQAPYIVTLPVTSGGPDVYPPLIAHVPLGNTTGSGPYEVTATVMDYSGVAEATVYYGTDGINFDQAAMSNVGGDEWAGDIPGQTAGTVVYYYIEAVDASPQSNVAETDVYDFSVLAVLFYDDMESGAGDWTHEALGSWTDQWHMSTQQSHSGTNAWKFGDTGTGTYANSSDGVLTSPVITIGDDCELSFWHRIDAEASGTYPDSAYDGGVVEISLNGGAWGTVPMAYTHTVRTTAGGGNPYTGPFPPNTPLFSGAANWAEMTADLSAYVGDVQIRFRFGSDASAAETGWFVDDVQIIGLPTGSLPDMDIELTYVSGSPVPAIGGNLTFDVFVENLEPTSVDFDAWLEVSYEGGDPTTLLQRAFTGFQSGWQINRPGSWYPIPGSYAAGNYVMAGKVGSHPAVAWDESSFPFVKEGIALEGFVPYPTTQSFPDPFDGLITGDEVAAAPSEFTMAGNYPNPFNPTTTFNFALPEMVRVTLKVYNLQGQLVDTIVDGLRDAGTHEVTFDASHLASGIYLYQMQAGDQQINGKMVLVK